MYDDLNDHPFAVFMAGERDTDLDAVWEAWVKKVEAIIGHSLDGDQERDGYSLDFANDAFGDGLTPEQYAAEVMCGNVQLDSDKDNSAAMGNVVRYLASSRSVGE